MSRAPTSWPTWRTCWTFTPNPTTPRGRWSVSTRPPPNFWPIPAQPGHPRREDYEYRREGTRNLFLCIEPLAGWRHVAVTERRTTQDFAHQMR